MEPLAQKEGENRSLWPGKPEKEGLEDVLPYSRGVNFIKVSLTSYKIYLLKWRDEF